MGPQRALRRPAASNARQKTKEPPASPSKQQTLLPISPSQSSVAGKLKSLRKPQASQKTSQCDAKATAPPTSKRSATAKVESQEDTQNGTAARGSIQSFFNAATQRLQASQESPRRASRASTPLGEPAETIDSDEDSASVLSLSKGSSTALALRKRKSYHSNGTFGQGADDSSLPASQKFRRTGEATRTPSMALHNDDKRPWTVQFAPASLAELAVHKRKVDDLRGWLQSALAGRRNKVLIIKGPAGAGKTATLRLLAQELGVETLEWSNPAGKDYVDSAQTSSAQFEEFVARSGRSTGLRFAHTDEDASERFTYDEMESVQPGSQLLLVEEFPNTFSKTSPALQSFRSAIAQHLVARGTTAKPIPLVMIISETLLSTNTAAADSFTTHRLLGPELSIHPLIDTIEFNAIAPTILLKALETVVVKEARKSGRRTTPGPIVLKRLTEFGDIRSAISTLEFLCLRGDEDGNWSAKIAFSKPKKKVAEVPLTKLEKETLSWISSRESTLGIWHGVGKVVYNKRVDKAQPDTTAELPPWLSEHHRARVPENDVNVLMNDIGTDTTTFIAALHENYPLSCTALAAEPSLQSVLGCIEALSDSDLLCLDRFSAGGRAYSGSSTDSLRQDEMSFQLAVRGLLFHLPANAKRTASTGSSKIDAHRMYYPASLKLWRRREEVEYAIESLKLRLRSLLRAPLPTPHQDGSEGRVEQVSSSWLALASNEFLVQCLPYLASSLPQFNEDRTLAELLRTITRFTGMLNDDSMADDFDDNGQQAEQWTTDIPDDSASRDVRRARLVRKGDSLAFASGGLKLHAEHGSESLVLEDDDIVDD